MIQRAKPILVEISPGELIDRITILQIKAERMADPEKLSHVRGELSTLLAVCEQAVSRSEAMDRLTTELRGINESLWQIEDELRQCEADGQFGPGFIELARSVYRNNDRRYAVKRRISEVVGAKLVEEKLYPRYG